MVSDVTLQKTAYDAAKTSNQSDKLAEDFNQFLILLTTQIQNQDPLNPMDSTEFTNQLVQFSGVEQAINTNQKLDSLINMQINNITGMSLGFVGMDISYPSAELYYNGEDSSKITYVLDELAFEAKINVRDASGNLVFSDSVSKDTGVNHYEWDGAHMGGGKVEPGTYSISIDATNIDDDPIAVTTVVTGRVTGVETQNGIPFLLVGDRAVSQSNVINATLPPAEVADETDATDTTDETDETGDDTAGDDTTDDDTGGTA